jgi:hypothetical protein
MTETLPAGPLNDILSVPERREKLRAEIAHVLNVNCAENGSDTPDYILAEYLVSCLEAWNHTTRTRDKWWSFKPWK